MATLPIVTSAAPLSKAMRRSSSALMPPPKSHIVAGGRSQAFQYFMVDDMFDRAPLEVHDVQTFEAVTFKFPCHGYRVFVVGLLRGVISFGQPYAFAVYQVYGRYQFDHTVKSKSFFQYVFTHASAFLRMELRGVEIVFMQGSTERHDIVGHGYGVRVDRHVIAV